MTSLEVLGVLKNGHHEKRKDEFKLIITAIEMIKKGEAYGKED